MQSWPKRLDVLLKHRLEMMKMLVREPIIGLAVRTEISPEITKEFSLIRVSELEVCKLLMDVAMSDFVNFPKLDLNDYPRDVPSSLMILDREFSKRRKLIVEKFRSDLIKYLYKDSVREGNMKNSQMIKEDYTEYVYLIPSLRSIAESIISEIARVLPLAICTDKLNLSIPSTYICEFDENSLVSVPKRFMALKCRMEDIFHTQVRTGIRRDEFNWFANPLVAPIRELCKNTVLDTIKEHPGLSEFDLSIQLLMHLAAKDAFDVWNIPSHFSSLVNKDLFSSAFDGKKQKCFMLIHDAIRCGAITLDYDLVQSECVRLAAALNNHFAKLKVVQDGKDIYLPAQKMNDAISSPFLPARHRTEIDLKGSFYTEKDGEKVLVAREKHSGKTIFFAPVSPEISRLYSQGFCNLHYANPGEIAVYGAFVEGSDMPFAYSSYSAIGYRYTAEMLQFLGYCPTTIIESSRAWNSTWAPENTMSILFTYAKDRVAELYAREGRKLEGIITSINPNLGFKASAFRGLHFKVASIKPTVFSYYLDDDGSPTFMTKRDIVSLLGVSVSELRQSKHYTDNKIPFLPTVEMLYLLNKKKRAELDKTSIYVVTDDDYLYNR